MAAKYQFGLFILFVIALLGFDTSEDARFIGVVIGAGFNLLYGLIADLRGAK